MGVPVSDFYTPLKPLSQNGDQGWWGRLGSVEVIVSSLPSSSPHP